MEWTERRKSRWMKNWMNRLTYKLKCCTIPSFICYVTQKFPSRKFVSTTLQKYSVFINIFICRWIPVHQLVLIFEPKSNFLFCTFYWVTSMDNIPGERKTDIKESNFSLFCLVITSTLCTHTIWLKSHSALIYIDLTKPKSGALVFWLVLIICENAWAHGPNP